MISPLCPQERAMQILSDGRGRNLKGNLRLLTCDLAQLDNSLSKSQEVNLASTHAGAERSAAPAFFLPRIMQESRGGASTLCPGVGAIGVSCDRQLDRKSKIANHLLHHGSRHINYHF